MDVDVPGSELVKLLNHGEFGQQRDDEAEEKVPSRHFIFHRKKWQDSVCFRMSRVDTAKSA